MYSSLKVFEIEFRTEEDANVSEIEFRTEEDTNIDFGNYGSRHGKFTISAVEIPNFDTCRLLKFRISMVEIRNRNSEFRQ